MAHDSSQDLDDPREGQGEEDSLDGLAFKHLNSKAGRIEIADTDPSDVDDEVIV